MKYSSALLKKFISVNDTPENIAKNLILKTCEIEEVHTRILPDGVVIGKITSFAKHPEADKLNVCQVNCGSKGNYEIVCGGENVAEGIYVPVALPDCYLPAIDIKIEPRKLKGIVSNGMICSKEELGIKEDTDLHNIRNLGGTDNGESKTVNEERSTLTVNRFAPDFDDITDEDLGKPLKEKYPWLEGYVLEVDSKSLTNRPDLTGHFGAAVELNAIYANAGRGSRNAGHDNVNLTFNKVTDRFKQFATTNIIETLDNSAKLDRKVVAKTDGLNSYILLGITNVTVAQSSFFARLQMIDMGALPRANWIDFSNLFMLMTGQPIHFFDADKVDGDIIVRNAKEGEEFTDLFETTHILKETDIVIADKKKILALAGIVGGLESGISESTKNILVEIANFDSVTVRKTGTRLGLRTDAELRYEKNINPVYSLYCLLLFLEEITYYQKDLGNYDLGGLDYYASKVVLKDSKTPKKVAINYQKMSEFIFGKCIEDLPEDCQDFEALANLYLTGLGFTLEKKGDRVVPFWRSPDDINITEDIYEEIARIYGYDKIDAQPLLSPIENAAYTPYVAMTRKLEELLVERFGFVQTETYPWISEKVVRELGGNPEDLYMLQNPVNPETPYMRGDMVYGLLANVAKNSKFFDECKIFDIGKVRQKVPSAEYLVPSTSQLGTKNGELGTAKRFASSFVNERTALGMMMYIKNISSRDKDPLLYAKNILSQLITHLGIDTPLCLEKTDEASYHPKKQAIIRIADRETGNEKKIGFVGSLHPLILKDYKIPENAGVVYITFDIDTIIALLKDAGERQYAYETLQDQIVYRDLCFVVDAEKDFEGIVNAVKNVKNVKNIEVFDVYAGANLGEGKKSLAFKMKIMGDADATMTTEQINEVMNAAIAAGENAGGKLRS